MIARKTALVFLNSIAGGLLGLIAIKAIALWFDPLIVSRMSFPLGVLGIMYFVTDLGIGSAYVKRVSEGVDESDCFTTFLVFKAAATGVFIIAALALVYVRLVVQGVGFEDIALTAYLFLVGYYSLQSVRALYTTTFDAHRLTARNQLSMLVDTVARVSVTVLFAAVYAGVARNTGPLAGVLSADVAAFRLIAHYPSGALALTFLIGVAASVVSAHAQWRRLGVRLGRFRWDLMKSYWTFALPVFLLGIVTTLSGYIDRAAIGYFLSGDAAGVFELPKRFTGVLETIPWALGALLFPTISAMHARGDLQGIKETTEESLRYLSMLTLPVVTFVVIFSPRLISIFISDAWLEGAAAMSLLAAYTFVMGMIRPYYSLVSGMGRSDILAKVGALIAGSNIVLNVLLIPADIKSLGIRLAGLGVTGAALATLISGLLGYAAIYYAASRFEVRVHARGFLRHLLASAVMGGVLLAMHHFDVYAFVRWYDFLIYTALGGLVYVATLAALGEFSRRDLDFFMRVASVREMGRYVTTELFHRGKPPRD